MGDFPTADSPAQPPARAIAPPLWLRGYPESVPPQVDADVYPSLVAMIEDAYRRFAERPAVTAFGMSMTYADLEQASRVLAAHLTGELGVRRGERVAIAMPNSPQYPVILHGILRAGAVVVSVNPLYTAPEMAHVLADSGAVVAVAIEGVVPVIAEATAARPLRDVIEVRTDDVTLTRAIPASSCGTWTPIELGPQDTAFLQYTGGTTGTPMGVELTHRNLVANAEQCAAWFGSVLTEGAETMVTALPLYHVFALTVNEFMMRRLGGATLMMPDARDRNAMVRELARTPFTVMTGVNTLFTHLLDDPAFRELDFSSLRLTIAGGMAVQRPVAERWQAVTGVPLVEGYGLTEASPVTACNRPDLVEFTGSVGLPLPSTEVAVRSQTGEDLMPGEVGQLHFRGPQVMHGYWGRPDETAQAIGPDGFLATGDLGYVRHDGLVFIVDRQKDTIVVSGFNVYPREVEDVASRHPKVREIAVVGVPDPRQGEAVVAVVVPSDPTLTADELRADLRKSLAAYKVPHHVHFRDAPLPKTTVGKILRRELREELSR